MKPMTPVVPGCTTPEVVYAKDQPEYIPLPSHRTDDGTVITRWKLSIRERIRLLIGGSLWLSVLTFNHPLQPVKLDAQCPVAIGSGMIDNVFGFSFGKIMPPTFHAWFSRRTDWMFAAVWIRDERRHKWMWVNQERYYAGELQSIDSTGPHPPTGWRN